MSTARLIAICLLAALCGLGSPAAAQSWPGSRPIEVIIPFPAGGGVDAVGRAVVEALGEALRARVVAVNRDGPAGSIGFAALAAAPPDGHVLGFGPTTPITGARHMMRGVRYDVASFDYICQVFENVMSIAVAPGSRFRTAEELFAAARTAREPLTYGHAGVGSVPYLAIEHLAAGFGLRVAQVTFRGDGPMLPALLRGDLDFGAPAVSSIRGREFRPLAVFSDRRHPAFPEVPTVRELGVTGEMVPPGLNGLYGPRGLPASVRDRLREVCRTIVDSPVVRRTMETTGQVPAYLDGPEFACTTAEDNAFKARLIRRLGVSVE
jgi:tripartite-type tricarboxylate transporter receptor subunit TctC